MYIIHIIYTHLDNCFNFYIVCIAALSCSQKTKSPDVAYASQTGKNINLIKYIICIHTHI